MRTLIVEDGSARADANSYVSLAKANEYHSDRNNADWGGTDEELTAALLTAFESLESLYGPHYAGSINPTSQQAALFPRLPFEDANGRLVRPSSIPACLAAAQAEIALMVMQGRDVFPIRSTAQNVVNESLELGELKTSVQYGKAVEGEMFPGFRKVDLLLSPVLTTGRKAAYRLGL